VLHPLPFVEETRVHGADEAPEVLRHVVELGCARRFRNGLDERLVDFGEVAQQQTFRTRQAVLLDVAAERLEHFDHLARDGFRFQRLAHDPRMVGGESGEARVQELRIGLWMLDLF